MSDHMYDAIVIGSGISGACQNYMALTARAADYAVQETKKGNL